MHPALAQVPVVCQNLLLEVPCEHVIDVRQFLQVRFDDDRNMHAGGIQSAAQLVLLDEALDDVRSDPEIIEHRVALDGCTESENTLAGLARRGQVGDILVSHDLDAPRKLLVGAKRIASGGIFLLTHRLQTPRGSHASVRGETDDRPPVDWRQVGIEHRQAVPSQQSVNRFEGVIQQVFVVNLVERQILHDALHVQELYDEYPSLSKHIANRFADRVKLLEMKEDPGGVDCVELTADAAHGVLIEKGIERWDAAIVRDARGGL